MLLTDSASEKELRSYPTLLRYHKPTPMPWGYMGLIKRRCQAVTLAEAQDEAERIMGERIPIGTLRRWCSEGLLPKPTLRVASPKGGTIGELPKDTPAEIVATWQALHSESWAGRPSREAVRQARELAIEHRDNPNIFTERAVPGVLPDGREGYLLGGRLQPFVVTWGTTYAKVLAHRPWNQPAQVSYIYQRSNDRWIRQNEPRFADAAADSLSLSFEIPKPVDMEKPQPLTP